MNFKEMCAQKRTEKDREGGISRAALHWLDETLNVLQELPNISLVCDGPKVINVLRGPDIICEVKIEIGTIFGTYPFSRKTWRPLGIGYHVVASRLLTLSQIYTLQHYLDNESSSFHQIKAGVKGRKELRESIQFWLAQMVVDNNWDQTTTTTT